MKYNTKSILITFFTAFCLGLFLPTSFAAKYSAYVKKIESKADFERLKGEPLHHKYGQVYSVKVIQDIHSQKVYFINSNDYKYHYRFAIEYLHFYGDLTRFNDCNYSDVPCRNYVLATINYYTAIDRYTLEFSSTETLTASNFELYAAIKELIYFPDNFYLYPSTTLHRQNIIDQKISIPVITPNEIYGGLVYQPVHQTYSYGNLKFKTLESLKNDPINETDIVVLQGSPNQLDICAGVITVNFQTPLSHISILCQNRSIPLMALKNAWENKTLRALEDSLVKFSVGQDTFSISKASPEEFEKYQKKKLSNKKEIQLEKRLEVTKLVPLWNLNYESVDFVGGKAANFGELNKILKQDTNNLFSIPNHAFAIPFYYYDEHIKRSGADTLINNLSIFKGERIKLDSILNVIQILIFQTPVNYKLYQSLLDKMNQNKCNSLRFRSSTNAEDIKGFNGAGLYESATGSLLSKKNTIERAIKTVWASTWNLRAFQERNYFNINQQTVAMGILVHENFPDELINGVALTSNLYRDDMGGYTINCQMGEESIVHPKEGMRCEQFILLDEWEFHKTTTVADFISFSSLHPDSSLLKYEEIENLKLVLRTIKQHFYYNIPNNKSNGYSKFTLDIEFKLVGDERKLIIKQVRYY